MSWSGLHTGTHYSACPFTIRLPLSVTLSLLSLSWFPTFYHRESLFRVVPATIYLTYSPTLTFRPRPCSWSSYLGLSSRPLRLPFPIMLPHRSLASAFPTHSPHACRSGHLPPSFLSPLSLPILSPCPSPGWISPRCLSSLFLRRSYIFWCIFWCLYCPSPYQSVCTKMYGYFWERIHYPLQLPSSTVVGVGVNSCVPSEGEYTLSCDAW